MIVENVSTYAYHTAFGFAFGFCRVVGVSRVFGVRLFFIFF
jgi:hypothetical protein